MVNFKELIRKLKKSQVEYKKWMETKEQYIQKQREKMSEARRKEQEAKQAKREQKQMASKAFEQWVRIKSEKLTEQKSENRSVEKTIEKEKRTEKKSTKPPLPFDAWLVQVYHKIYILKIGLIYLNFFV